MLLLSCATNKAQYGKHINALKTENKEYNAEIEHTFYLIGDAGYTKIGEDLSHFNLLKKELSTADKNTTVLFLGNNVFEKGMPKKDNQENKLAEHQLNAQIDMVKSFKGQPIFIPGNNEYYNNGVEGLKREANYITEHLNNENSFSPKNGCPITSIDISDNVVLIIIDSQWYIENWNDNPTMNNDCDIKTREGFFKEYERLIRKNTLKTTVVAIHHPLLSYGSHSGQYSLYDQLYPRGGNIPLPVFGTLYNLLRKSSGLASQDMISHFYKELRKRLIMISETYENLIFVSGHEHNLQYIVQDQIKQIVSGSGSKTDEARVIEGSQFSFGGLGYAKLVKYKNGASWVYFYNEINGKTALLFKTAFQPKKTIEDKNTYNKNFPENISTSVYSEKQITKSGSYITFWGKHYRKFYGSKINTPTANIDSLFNGLTPMFYEIKNRAKTLHLFNKSGQEFLMTSRKKNVAQFLREITHKGQDIGDEFDNTYTEDLLLDLATTAHPFITLAVPKLSDAANLYHTNPTLYYIPKQSSLKQFNSNFGDELYLIEERATSGHGDIESFGYANTIISTNDLFNNLRNFDNSYVDEDTYIRARLFDMLIGDWNRDEEQWRWAEFQDKNDTIYKPVSQDRSQAFSKYDGIILEVLTRIIGNLKTYRGYDSKIGNIKWFNDKAHALDMTLINQSTYKDWKDQVNFLQENITDEVIENALAQLPSEVQEETISEIKDKLKGRLNNLDEIAKKYYKYIIKYPVVKGNDNPNWFDIEHLKKGKTVIKIYTINNNKKGDLLFEKTYSKKETSEIWIYGLDSRDVFNVTGEKNKVITLRIAGGQKNDIYNIETGKKVTIYDFETKENTFKTDKGNKRLFDDYEMNLFDYQKLKYAKNQFVPILGSNPDDGMKIGVADIFTIYGFERNPFSQQHTFEVGYYFSTKGYDLRYDAEFANVYKKWNLLIESYLTSPKSTRNFYGYGNESENLDDLLGKDYHRVPLSTQSIIPSLKWRGRMGSEFKIGTSLESFKIEKTDNINIPPNFKGHRNNYVGLISSFSYQNFNETSFPTLGMATQIELGWKTNVNTNKKENNGFIRPSVGFNYNLTSNKRLVLATVIKADIIIGNTFKFYNAASIGGIDGLRGYNNHRFTGNTSYYQNTDIRYNLTKFKTKVVPFQLGLFGGFDYGRVWYRGEVSENWKTSYGGGLWIDTAQLINFSLSAFKATEGVYFRFSLGFGFN